MKFTGCSVSAGPMKTNRQKSWQILETRARFVLWETERELSPVPDRGRTNKKRLFTSSFSQRVKISRVYLFAFLYVPRFAMLCEIYLQAFEKCSMRKFRSFFERKIWKAHCVPRFCTRCVFPVYRMYCKRWNICWDCAVNFEGNRDSAREI